MINSNTTKLLNRSTKKLITLRIVSKYVNNKLQDKATDNALKNIHKHKYN